MTWTAANWHWPVKRSLSFARAVKVVGAEGRVTVVGGSCPDGDVGLGAAGVGHELAQVRMVAGAELRPMRICRPCSSRAVMSVRSPPIHASRPVMSVPGTCSPAGTSRPASASGPSSRHAPRASRLEAASRRSQPRGARAAWAGDLVARLRPEVEPDHILHYSGTSISPGGVRAGRGHAGCRMEPGRKGACADGYRSSRRLAACSSAAATFARPWPGAPRCPPTAASTG